VKLSKKKAGKVTAADIDVPSDIKILNSDMYVTEIDQDKLELDIEIRIEKGVGYMSVEDLKEREGDVNVLLIDANFSPVLNVNYDISSTRVGDLTNLDAIEMNISTNGAMSPAEVFKFFFYFLFFFSKKVLYISYKFSFYLKSFFIEEIKV